MKAPKGIQLSTCFYHFQVIMQIRSVFEDQINFAAFNYYALAPSLQKVYIYVSMPPYSLHKLICGNELAAHVAGQQNSVKFILRSLVSPVRLTSHLSKVSQRCKSLPRE